MAVGEQAECAALPSQRKDPSHGIGDVPTGVTWLSDYRRRRRPAIAAIPTNASAPGVGTGT